MPGQGRKAGAWGRYYAADLRSEQQDFNAVRMHGVFTRRPRKDREVPILGCDERDGVALILHELRGRQVTRAADLPRVNALRNTAFDRLGRDEVLDRLAAALAANLGAEGEQFIAVGDDRGAVDSRQAGERIDGSA